MFFSKEKKNVLILGYMTAGKSTIVDQLMLKKLLRERREETHGSKTREITIQLGEISHSFKITDVGGSKQYQDLFWKADIAKADGIIYIIDNSLLYTCQSGGFDDNNCPNRNDNNKLIKCGCPENAKFVKSREAKAFAFSILDTGKPILIFGNKIDLADKQRVYTLQEMASLYNINENDKYNTKIEAGSALTGENVFEAVNWLFTNMEM